MELVALRHPRDETTRSSVKSDEVRHEVEEES
jgi:hypothetical protein